MQIYKIVNICSLQFWLKIQYVDRNLFFIAFQKVTHEVNKCYQQRSDIPYTIEGIQAIVSHSAIGP